jgi:hypothetical protein
VQFCWPKNDAIWEWEGSEKKTNSADAMTAAVAVGLVGEDDADGSTSFDCRLRHSFCL